MSAWIIVREPNDGKPLRYCGPFDSEEAANECGERIDEQICDEATWSALELEQPKPVTQELSMRQIEILREAICAAYNEFEEGNGAMDRILDMLWNAASITIVQGESEPRRFIWENPLPPLTPIKRRDESPNGDYYFKPGEDGWPIDATGRWLPGRSVKERN
jgi:hypothetical protein